MLVDFFPYFDPTGRAVTELRIRMYENIVDQFIICESNKTHSGKPAPIGLRDLIREANLPAEKIRIIDLNIPDDDKLELIELDYDNCYENNHLNMNSVRARARERLQKNAILSVLDDYDDNTHFIICDQDEIINPEYINWIRGTVDAYPNNVVKVPMVQLEGRADLRVYDKTTGNPKKWDASVSIMKKHHLKNTTPILVRSGMCRTYAPLYLTLNGSRVEDMGWHFSWMGGNRERIAKLEGFAHYDDTFSHLVSGSYANAHGLLTDMPLVPGAMPPSCNKNEVLMPYPHDKLPKEIFELPRVQDYLLPKGEYCFTQDWFSNHVIPINGIIATLQPKRILEIGSFEGRSTTHFIEQLKELETLEITCIDTWQGGIEHEGLDFQNIESNFDQNVAIAAKKFRGNLKINKRKGDSIVELSRLIVEGDGNYDFVYIDGSHVAMDVLADAVLAFHLARVGAVLIFDDYKGGDFENKPYECPRVAVDSFINVMENRLNILYFKKGDGTEVEGRKDTYQCYLMKMDPR